MTKNKLSLLSLVLLIVSAIDSIRNLPGAALFGSEMIFFFILSAALFLLPTALVSAELTAAHPEEGGIYHWVRKALGPRAAMLAVWLQWINTMVWFPSILTFIAGTTAYLIEPDMADSKTFTLGTILILFWALTFCNLKGIQASAKLNSAFAIIGTVIPMTILIACGIGWIFSGQPTQLHFTFENLLPTFYKPEGWVSLVAIMASFLGMELAGVHVNDVDNPKVKFPKAVLYSAAFILLTMLFGSLTIALIIPGNDIQLVAGVPQTFALILDRLGLKDFLPVLIVMIVVGTLGNMINWLISPAKGLLHAAQSGFLPKAFSKVNNHGVASTILLSQALCVSVVCAIFLFVPSVNAFYWFLLALSTSLYMMMYILMFVSALILRPKDTKRSSFQIPGGRAGLVLTSSAGILGAILTIFVGFFPPAHVDVGHPLLYAFKIGCTLLMAVAPVLWFFRAQSRSVVNQGDKVMRSSTTM